MAALNNELYTYLEKIITFSDLGTTDWRREGSVLTGAQVQDQEVCNTSTPSVLGFLQWRLFVQRWSSLHHSEGGPKLHQELLRGVVQASHNLYNPGV